MLAQDINFSSEYNKIVWPVALGLSGGITGDDGSGKRLALYHGGSISLQTGSNAPGIANSRVYIDGSGNVGIGTTSPDGFQVNRSLSSEASYAASNIRMGMLGGTPRLILDYAGSTPFEIDNNAGRLRIFKPGVELFTITSGGSVGIGTTTPGSYTLAVAGKVAATGEVRVFTTGTTSFPDYVFDPAYQLPSLEETEKYVKENHHLPEVPSAAEIEKDGMSLNGMNTILLKKVEELTLYMIEMKKKTEELQKENVELKARVGIIENKK